MSIDWKVHTYATLPSTQDYVTELAEEGLPEGTVVQCLTQTKGRGRQGNQWISPMGNLYMSALLRPGCPAAEAGQISFVAALALSAAINELIAPGHHKTLKWPNDILIDGKKCAGILLESELSGGNVDWLVMGIGVNILSAPEGAVCLREVCKGQVPIHPFRDMLLSHFAAYYKHWRERGFAEIRESWLAQAHGLGQPMTARLSNGTQQGVFRGIDADGALRLEQDNGKIIAINSGEVYFDPVN